jgi:hypothetical protein
MNSQTEIYAFRFTRSERRKALRLKFVSSSFLAFVCVILLSSASLLRSEDGASVSGYLIVKSFSPRGQLMSQWSSTNEFRASIARDGRYAVEIRPKYEKGEDIIYLTFDGFDTYFVHYQKSGDDKNSVYAKTPAYISEGNYPFSPWEEQKRANILWLVYGAGLYIHDSMTNNTMPLPWVPARWSLLAYGYRVEHELSPNLPYIPHQLRFIRDYALDLSSEDAEMNRPELDTASGDQWVAKWKDELNTRNSFTNGFLDADINTDDFTNRNGVEIPLFFSWRDFNPHWLNGGLRCQYNGIVTNVTDLSPSETFLPPVLGSLGVNDSRFRYRDAKRALDGINYRVTIATSWKPRNSPQLKEQFKAGLSGIGASPRNMPSEIRKKRLVAAAVVLFFALFLPVFLYMVAKRNKRGISQAKENL